MPAERRSAASPAEVVEAASNAHSARARSHLALDIFVGGCRRDEVRPQLFGWAVLRSATERQGHDAMIFGATRQGLPVAEIEAMLAR